MRSRGNPPDETIPTIQADDRCHVIKALQEQAQEPVAHRSDYQQMERRALLAEQALSMRETEVKLKFEELEETFVDLDQENRQLRERIAALSRRSTNQSQSAPPKSEYEQKAIKWKTKYRAPARTNAEMFEPSQSEPRIEQLQRENEELQTVNRSQQEQIQKLTEHLRAARDSRPPRSEFTFQQQNKQLKAELESLRGENHKLQQEKSRQIALLKNNRQTDARKKRKQQQIQAETASEIAAHRKRNQSKEGEITRLRNALGAETQQRRAMEKALQQMSRTRETAHGEFRASIKRLETENTALRRALSRHEHGNQSLASQLEILQSEKEDLETELTDADQTRPKKLALESSVAELTEVARELQNRVVSLESVNSEKVQELRNLLIQHFGGLALGYQWSDCVDFTNNAFSDLNELRSVCQSMGDRAQKLEKRNQRLKTQLAAQTRPEMPSARLLSGPEPRPQEVSDSFGQFNSFRDSLSRQMSKLFFKMSADVAALSEPDARPILRPLILAVVMANRWRTFKRSDPIDSHSILNYAVPRTTGSQLVHLRDRYSEVATQLKQETASNLLLTKANHDLELKDQQLEEDLRKCRDDLQQLATQKSELQEKLEAIEERSKLMIDRERFEAVHQQLHTANEGRQQTEEQLASMKTEMRNLIDSLDGGQYEMADLHGQIVLLAEENEEYRQLAEDLRHQLAVAKAALKDRTKELLALERELMKRKTKAVIIKDPIPTAAARKEEDGPMTSSRFFTTDIRSGLTRMQDELLRGDSLI
jgi:hypothetical protein